MPALVFAIAISGRKPDPQKTSVAKDSAAKLMQTQITRGVRRSCEGRRIVFSFSDARHRGIAFVEKRTHKAKDSGLRKSQRILLLITPAKAEIDAMIASELKHKMHQVSKTKPST